MRTLTALAALTLAACASPRCAAPPRAVPVTSTVAGGATSAPGDVTTAPASDAAVTEPAPSPVQAAPAPAPAPVAEPPAPPQEAAPPRFTIKKGTRVLIFGDSMVTSGLGVYLQERVVARGGKFFSVSKGSSTTASWSDGHELEKLLALTHPDIVLVVLASNELFVPNPHAREYAIRSIVSRVGARECLWIGPSPWLPEKGIIGVVRSASSPCRFYDSSPLPMERQADHIHPTMQGGKAWAEAVWHAAFED